MLQGSIPGPLLFIIYINDLSKASDLFTTITYADNTTLTYSSHTVQNSTSVSQLINEELININNWFKSNKLSLNIEKTNFMIFHSSGSILTDVN